MPLTRRFPFRMAAILGLWIAAVITGVALVMQYEGLSGSAPPSPARWPDGIALARSAERPTLLTFFHPRCPCSQASLDELIALLTRCGDAVECTIVFVHPPGASTDWSETSLWKKASLIPNTRLLADRDGLFAKEFNVQTSGYTLLYSSTGELHFRGGITASRGQAGPNAGRESLLQLIKKTSINPGRAPVYGCPLFDSPTTEGKSKWQS